MDQPDCLGPGKFDMLPMAPERLPIPNVFYELIPLSIWFEEGKDRFLFEKQSKQIIEVMLY